MEPKGDKVYFIVDDDSVAVKIGVAFAPESRMKEMQTGNPHKLRLAKVILNGNHKLEKELHRIFSDYALEGEWFRLAAEIKEFLGEKQEPKEIQLCEEFRNFFPPLSDEQKAGLEKDILAHGCLAPLILWGDTLIDGYHRYDICQKHGVRFQTVSFKFEDKFAAMYWLLSHQRNRRNLSKYELATRALSLRPVIEKKAEEQRQLAGELYHKGKPKVFQNLENLPIHTDKELARLADVSHDTIYKVQIILRSADQETKEKLQKGELTINQAYGQARALERRKDITNIPTLPPGKYQVIYADPPWQYRNSGLGGSAESHYSTMPMDKLENLKADIQSRATDDAVLFLWVTSPFLPKGLELCQAWGFEYKTNFVWIKDKSTYGKLGFYSYSQHEFLFVATKGSCLPWSDSLHSSLIIAPKGEHSAKPELVYEIIERMYPGPYIELFARKKRPNWESWGTL